VFSWTGHGKATTLDGIRIDLGDEWVLVLLGDDQPSFHIVAEGRSHSAATSLAET
jgi:mannose-1-phosphate guanylyltransferase/phosphomannomutase